MDDREAIYRGMIMTLAEAIWNGENWDRATVADLLKIDELPEELTDEHVMRALDKIMDSLPKSE